MFNWFLLHFVALLLIKAVNSQAYIGQKCTIRGTGENGACKLLENCPAAIAGLQSQRFPQTCGFQGTHPIVCCAGDSSEKTTTARTTTTRATRPTPTTPTTSTASGKEPDAPGKVGDKSWKKCREYGQYVFIDSPVAPLGIGGEKPKKVRDCQISNALLIVGGEKAKLKEFPHMALIGFDKEDAIKWECGGSLISDQYVLTAGHCIYSQQYGDAKFVRLGELVINDENDHARTQQFQIAQIVKHPQYMFSKKYNDLALMRLNRLANLNPHVRPLCLYTKPGLPTKRAIATGWGKTGYTAATSSDLLKVTLDFFTAQECNETYQSNIDRHFQYGIVEQSQICAGSYEQKDACQGDSGGPLQVYNHEVDCMYYVVGVTSFGKGCGIGGIPGIYTRVSNYIEWIESVVWP